MNMVQTLTFGPVWAEQLQLHRLTKELETLEMKHQLAIQRHEDEVADLPLGQN